MAGKSLAPTALAFLPGTTASALVRFQPRALSVAFSSGSPMTVWPLTPPPPVLPPPDDDDCCAGSSVTIASEWQVARTWMLVLGASLTGTIAVLTVAEVPVESFT